MPHKVDTIYIIFTCVKDKKLSKQYQYYSVFKNRLVMSHLRFLDPISQEGWGHIVM